MIRKVKEFYVDPEDIMNGNFQDRVKDLVDQWKTDLDKEGFVIVSPTIDLETVAGPFDNLRDPVKVLVSLGVEEKGRDKRWENVTAHISVPQGYFYEDENSQFNPLELVEFLIEVRFGKSVFYSKIIVHKNDLDEPRLRTYQFTLDKMVEQIDYYISTSMEE